MNNLVTGFYCSSNREKPEFEQRIRDNILKYCGDMPIISVTQKPIDFGTNICVGDHVGVSGKNFFLQTLIALQHIKTPFALSLEADTVYGPSYFNFVPPRLDKCYRNKNLYVMGQFRSYFFKKEEGATHSQIVGTEFYRKRLEELFKGNEDWDFEEKERNWPKEQLHAKRDDIFNVHDKDEIEYYETDEPVIQIKTSQSMRHYTNSDRIPRYSLPFWGSGSEFRDKFYNLSTGERH